MDIYFLSHFQKGGGDLIAASYERCLFVCFLSLDFRGSQFMQFSDMWVDSDGEKK